MWREPADNFLKTLRERASMLRQARTFFSKRKILEVDCCALRRFPAIDANIDAMSAPISDQETGFLHTSPEYAMKQLLAQGSGDLYYLGHVFRKGDLGHLHAPEFTMAEWYRLRISFSAMIQEACDFLLLFLGPLPIRTISYRESFERHLNLDYTVASLANLQEIAHNFSSSSSANWSRDTYIHFLLTHAIEPNLGRGELTVLTDYPPHEAALACIVEKNGEKVAERFEIYYAGIELANGYHELGDPCELRRRFEEENKRRYFQKKETYCLDEPFLATMQQGFPDCCGVSVGFDRALMIRQNAQSVAHVLPFALKRPTYPKSSTI